MSLSARRAWIEILWDAHGRTLPAGSLSARRAWIEITIPILLTRYTCVALRKESVDRNISLPLLVFCLLMSLSARRAWIEIVAYLATSAKLPVALRKESVDRNPNSIRRCLMSVVALRKESVDRNCRNRFCPTCQWRSLSARRAWIEMPVLC